MTNPMRELYAVAMGCSTLLELQEAIRARAEAADRATKRSADESGELCAPPTPTDDKPAIVEDLRDEARSCEAVCADFRDRGEAGGTTYEFYRGRALAYRDAANRVEARPAVEPVKLWVVMNNDFPCGAATTEERAKQIAAASEKHWADMQKGEMYPRHVYIKIYEYTDGKFQS